MKISASPTASRTPFGKFLIRAAVATGHRINSLEASIRNAGFLSAVPPQYRRVGSRTVKLILLLAVASISLFLAIGVLALWIVAALPISADRQPRIHAVSHPKHQLKYPEMYGDDGAPR